MIPYIRIKGENSFTCNSDLIIIDENIPIVISLIDYGIKTKKVVADILNGRNSVHVEDREDITFSKDLNVWSSSFNFKNDKQGELTHTIIKNKRVNEYIIDWNNIGKVKSILNYIRNKHYIPVTENIIEKILNASKYVVKEIEVYTNNPEFENLNCYYVNMHEFKRQLKLINIEMESDNFNWDEIETIEDYLFTFLEPIKNKINKTVKVLYNPKNINKGIYDGISPFSGQVPIIQSGIEVLNKNKFVYIGAEQGVGKTLIGSKINHNYFKENNKNTYVTLVVAPAITLTQWKDEIKRSTTDKLNIILIKKTEDFIKWYRKHNNEDNKKPTYLLIGKETFKLSYAKTPSFRKAIRFIEVKEMDEWYKRNGYYQARDYMYSIRKKKKEILTCPDCGYPLKNPNRTREDVFYEEKDFKNINKGNYKCGHCNSVLWSATYNKTKKTSVIDFIHRKRIKFDSVILDEMHEQNNSSSIIGNSIRTLIREHSKKVIALSGTTNNGYASSLHNLLIAVCPNKLKQDECLDIKDFISKYGTLQAVTDINNDNKKTYFSRGKSEIKDSEFKEIEGINPIVFTKYLIDKSIFATLDDLGKDLPPIHEYYIPVKPEHNQIIGENSLFEDIKKANSFNAKMYVDSIIKHYINNPFNWSTIPIETENGEEYIQPTNLDIDILPKEIELINIVKQEVKEGRKVWIYTDFNNGGEYMKGEKLPNRIEKLLKNEGLKVYQLKPSVKTYDRKDVIDANKDNYDVFISNAKLVNVGINLVFCPTYIFYMPSYHVNVVNQASRRGYRANSTLENRIYHLYYQDTWEDIIIKRYQRKLAESKAINGQFDVVLENDNIRTASQFSTKLSDKIIV